ncbi:hypothetical protein QBC35DRAFT_180892 [Podospora australis]|uniref:SnoaL-like domain-containing protein n=1 Tax=Podospora australis TaxID=1536484 RepID=A0AAN6WJD0_9PEZI|nr:hypothetical protein QBC35DRAFT_180892 [Podospora australis]
MKSIFAISSTRRRTIEALLDGYSSLDPEKIIEPLSDDFTHLVLPASLGMPTRNKEEFAVQAACIFHVFESFQMIADEIYEDIPKNTIVIHARMHGQLNRGRREDRAWRNECILIVRLSKDGREVCEIQEFVDSVKATEMARKYAPKHFMLGSDRQSNARLLRNVVMFTALASCTFVGVRRWMRRND